MDILLLILGLAAIVAGIAGSFLPVLPGPPLAWLGLLLLYCTDAVPVNPWILWGSLAVTVLVSVLDYVIPAQGTKRFGGSRYGVWGTNIGLVAGLIVPIPFGVVVGPFLGAFLGELFYNVREKSAGNDTKRAFRAAMGSFAGFLASTFIKFVICIIFLGVFLTVSWQHRHTF